jgi:hypothetical protein
VVERPRWVVMGFLLVAVAVALAPFLAVSEMRCGQAVCLPPIHGFAKLLLILLPGSVLVVLGTFLRSPMTERGHAFFLVVLGATAGVATWALQWLVDPAYVVHALVLGGSSVLVLWLLAARQVAVP